jgi:hypothetical protein
MTSAVFSRRRSSSSVASVFATPSSPLERAFRMPRSTSASVGATSSVGGIPRSSSAAAARGSTSPFAAIIRSFWNSEPAESRGIVREDAWEIRLGVKGSWVRIPPPRLGGIIDLLVISPVGSLRAAAAKTASRCRYGRQLGDGSVERRPVAGGQLGQRARHAPVAFEGARRVARPPADPFLASAVRRER